jgi:hypothetical protein
MAPASEAASRYLNSLPQIISERLVLWIFRFPSQILGVVVAITILLGAAAGRNSFEHELKDLLGSQPEYLVPYFETLRLFGPDDQIVVVLAADGMTPETLEAAFRMRTHIEKRPGILSVLDISGIMGIESPEKLEWFKQRPRFLARKLQELGRSAFCRGYLLALDGRAQTLLIHPDQMPAGDLHRLVRDLRALVAKEAGTKEWHLFGYPVFAERYILYLARDNAKFIGLSLIGALVLSFLLFGSVRLTAAISGIVLIPVIWLHGLFALSGNKITLYSSLLTPIILFIGLSLAVQLLNRVFRVKKAMESKEESSPTAILRTALRQNLVPGFFCALTTAGGFFSQAFSPMQGIRAFSVFAALGCWLAFFAVYIILPILLAFFLKPGSSVHMHNQSFLSPRIGKTLLRMTPPPKVVTACALVFSLALGSGVVFLVYGREPMSALPATDPLVAADRLIQETFLLGSRQISVLLTPKHAPFTQPETMLSVRDFAARLASEPGVLSVLSPWTLVEEVLGELSDGKQKNPDSEADIERALRLASQRLPGLVRGFLNPPFHDRGRVLVSLAHGDPTSVVKIAQRAETIAAEVAGGHFLVQPTGRLFLSAAIENQTLKFQVSSMGMTVIGIFLLIGAAFRRQRALWISLLANLLPIISALGALGWLGVRLDPATVMGPCLCLGTIVDDTIHLMHGFFRDETVHQPKTCHIRCLIELAWPVTATSLLLVFGLGILGFSSFGPTRNFGAFAAFTLAIGLVFDLWLTPALLTLSGKGPKKGTGA